MQGQTVDASARETCVNGDEEISGMCFVAFFANKSLDKCSRK